MWLSSFRILMRSLVFVSILHMQALGETCDDYFRAIEDGNFHLVFRYSLQKKPALATCLTDEGENAMHLFAKGQTSDSVFAVLLFLAQVDINGKNVRGETPLMYAAHYNNLASLTLLLLTSTQKVVIDEQDLAGNTALHHAAQCDNVYAMRKLQYFGARGDLSNLDHKQYRDYQLRPISSVVNEKPASPSTIAKPVQEKTKPKSFGTAFTIN